MRSFASYLSLAFAASLLAACSSNIASNLDTRQNAGPCPSVGSIYDVARYVKFADADGELYSNIDYSAEIVDVRLFCRYVEDEPMRVELDIDFAFGKGPSATGDAHTYPYFVSVTRRSGKVLGKQSFEVAADFEGDRVAAKTESVNDIVIPRIDESISGANFEILVGFELTEDQLAFNRAGKRFRLNAED